jgi:hypothetical protein
MRAVARGFAVEPNTGRAWLMAVAAHAAAGSRDGLHDGPATPGQLEARVA